MFLDPGNHKSASIQNTIPSLDVLSDLYFVKLQSKVQTSVLGLGVDFVSPCHTNNKNNNKNKKKNPHQNLSEGGALEVQNLTRTG